ncbi:thermonuclease family protein [Salinibacter sp.]|uniref:thermonuclease family protein n=1 Tax=Salinibacter sp. TaxID=2065818 RepID=UPI003D71535F
MPDTFRFSVSRVKDGDTVVVESKNGDTTAVRPWGIDAPEPPEPCGPAATDVARQIVGGGTVTVEVMDEGPYGRIIGRVQNGDTDLAASLALSGYAWHSRQYSTCFSVFHRPARRLHKYPFRTIPRLPCIQRSENPRSENPLSPSLNSFSPPWPFCSLGPCPPRRKMHSSRRGRRPPRTSRLRFRRTARM